jgi:hypothetical protein
MPPFGRCLFFSVDYETLPAYPITSLSLGSKGNESLMNDSNTFASSMTGAAVHVVGGFVGLAGAIGGLSAIAYYFGWREQTAYYTALGCPWFVSMLSTSDFIQVSAPTLFSICVGAFLMFERLLMGSTTPRSLSRVAKWAGTIGFFGVTTLDFEIQKYVGTTAAHIIAITSLILLLCAAAWLIGDLISRLAQTELRWEAQHIWIVYLLIFYGLWTLPDSQGRMRANDDSDLRGTRLAQISIPQQISTETWRVVSAVDKQLLVMSLSMDGMNRHFRMIEAKDAASISDNRTP